jgi:serine/threonine protein kinase
MEYCELGDLQRYLSRYDLCPRGFLPESQVREIASQLLNALLMMHEEKFAHRDLKPAVSKNMIILIWHPDRTLTKGTPEYAVCQSPSQSVESQTQ